MKSKACCIYFIGVLGLVISAFIMDASVTFSLDSTETGPGAGFWPFALGVALGTAAVILLIYTFFNRERLKEEKVLLFMPANRRVYLLLGMIETYCFLITLFGFYPASAILIPCIMALMGEAIRKTVILTTFGALIFIYLVFGIVLHTQMPQSIFWE